MIPLLIFVRGVAFYATPEKWTIILSRFVFSRFVPYFDEVARHGSIRKAAEHLHVSASAIDRQLLRAEEEFGTPLFERLPRGLRLTAAGEILIYGLRRWQRDLSRMKFEIEELRGLRRGEVRIAVVEGATGEFVPNALASFIHDHPRISHRVVVAGSDRVLHLVLDGQADFGLAFNPPPASALRIEGTVKFRLGAVVTPDHPFAKLRAVKLSDCMQYPLVIPDDSTSLRAVVDAALMKTKARGQPAVTASSIALMKAIVAQDCGVGLMTAIDALPESRAGQLVYVPIIDRSIPASVLSLIVATDRHLSIAAILAIRYFAVLLDEMERLALGARL